MAHGDNMTTFEESEEPSRRCATLPVCLHRELERPLHTHVAPPQKRPWRSRPWATISTRKTKYAVEFVVDMGRYDVNCNCSYGSVGCSITISPLASVATEQISPHATLFPDPRLLNGSRHALYPQMDPSFKYLMYTPSMNKSSDTLYEYSLKNKEKYM